jgi:hypothetical protein
MGDFRFVAPDNGVLSIVAARHPPTRVVELTKREFWRPDVSSTFHGRDILGPVAAYWSRGVDLSHFGETTKQVLADLPQRRAERLRKSLQGDVLWADSFGNLVTNIESNLLPREGREKLTVQIGSHTIHGIQRCYGEHRPGTLVALIGSSGRLEIAVNRGNAAKQLQLKGETRVRVGGLEELDDE